MAAVPWSLVTGTCPMTFRPVRTTCLNMLSPRIYVQWLFNFFSLPASPEHLFVFCTRLCRHCSYGLAHKHVSFSLRWLRGAPTRTTWHPSSFEQRKWWSEPKKTLHLRMKKEIWKANWAWLLLEIWWWRWQQCNSFFLSWVIGKKRGSWLLCGFFLLTARIRSERPSLGRKLGNNGHNDKTMKVNQKHEPENDHPTNSTWTDLTWKDPTAYHHDMKSKVMKLQNGIKTLQTLIQTNGNSPQSCDHVNTG